MADTSIEWTEKAWNPATGCDRVSPGCDNCYALTMAARLKGMGQPKYQRDGDPRTSGPGFGLTVHPDALDLPMHWRKPTRIFVNSMSDLFHQDVPDDFIRRVFDVMGATERHTYQLLTKRHGRMRSLLRRWSAHADGRSCRCPDEGPCTVPVDVLHGTWPLPNVWVGVSVENQKWADIRIPALLDTPAAVRWISAEPLLGGIDLDQPRCDDHDRLEVVTDSQGWERCGFCAADGFSGELSFGHWLDPLNGGIDWVVAGGESGPGARPAHIDWFRLLRDQCAKAEVPFFMKQNGAYGLVEDRPRWGDVWVSLDGSTRPWTSDDGHTRSGGAEFRNRDAVLVRRVGKKAAGRLLDGATWDQFPAGQRLESEGSR